MAVEPSERRMDVVFPTRVLLEPSDPNVELPTRFRTVPLESKVLFPTVVLLLPSDRNVVLPARVDDEPSEHTVELPTLWHVTLWAIAGIAIESAKIVAIRRIVASVGCD